MYQQDVSVQKWFRFTVAWKTLDVELEDERLPWRLMAQRYILCIDWLILDILVSHTRRPTTHTHTQNEALPILFSVLMCIVTHVIAICVSRPAYGVASDMPRHSLHCQSKELRSRVDASPSLLFLDDNSFFAKAFLKTNLTVFHSPTVTTSQFLVIETPLFLNKLH